VICWGIISWNWKEPFWVWKLEIEEEKAIAIEALRVYNINCAAEEKLLNNSWRLSTGWTELKD